MAPEDGAREWSMAKDREPPFLEPLRCELGTNRAVRIGGFRWTGKIG